MSQTNFPNTRWDFYIYDNNSRARFQKQILEFQKPLLKWLGGIAILSAIMITGHWINAYINPGNYPDLIPWRRIQTSVLISSTGIATLIQAYTTEKQKIANIVQVILLLPSSLLIIYASVYGYDYEKDY